MNKGLLVISVLLIAISCRAQDRRWETPNPVDYPVVAQRRNTIAEFVPENFESVSQVTGDLNGDDLPDAALYVKGVNSRFITKLDYSQYDANPRILLILFQEANGGGYRLAERSDRFIMTPDSPAMLEPFQSMTIKNRVLQINFELFLSAGGWGATNASHKFRYQNGKFYLIGADREDYMRNAVEIYKESYNFLTRKVKSTEGIRQGIEEAEKYDQKVKIRWRRLSNVRMRTLSELGLAFSWEISRGTFL